MSDAKEASEAEHLGNKLLQLCRKKAPEKDLLQVLEVGPFQIFSNLCARSHRKRQRARVSLSLSFVLLKAVGESKSDDAIIRFLLFLRVVFR